MLTDLGYRKRTFEEILNAKIAKAKELFGDDINTEENTALGKYIRINAYDQFNVEEIAEKVYYSIFPQTASGQSLDRLAWMVGMERNIAVPAQYKVKVTGEVGTTVEYGFLVGTENELNFFNTEENVIGEDGTCEIIVECVEAGTIGNVASNAINKIVNPVAEIDSVIGISVEQIGTEAESDYDFRKRFEFIREGKGSCTEASITSALANIPTVQGAYVVANESATETINGVPPKTIACYVDGGKNYTQEIGEAIFDKKPIGVGTYGDQSVTVEYGALTDYKVYFSYASSVDVYIDLTIITNDKFESSGYDEIKANLSTFIESIGIGDPLITTALYAHIYSVAGVVSAVVKVATDGANYGTDNISVDPKESLSFKQIKINGTII